MTRFQIRNNIRKVCTSGTKFHIRRKIKMLSVITIVPLSTVTVTLLAGSGNAIAQTSTVVSGKTNDGSRLRFYLESVRIENKYWRTFNYDLIQSDGTVLSRTATTPWCRKGKVELDERASSQSSSDYQKGASWFAIETGKIVYADSTASRNLLKKVCEASLQPKMQSTFVPSTPETKVSDHQVFTFVKEINRVLLKNNNSLWTLPNDQKVDIGINVCNALRKGYTNLQIVDLYFDRLENIQVSRYEGALLRDYIATIVVRAPQHFCPEYSEF